MYTIEYSVQLPGEAAPRRQTLQSDEPSWAALANDVPTRVVLPPAIFTPASAVSDEVLAT